MNLFPTIRPDSEKNNNSSVLLADIQVIKTYKTRGKDGEMKEQRVSPREELWPTR